MNGPRVVPGVPTPAEYLMLRRLGELSLFSEEAAAEGLGGTLFGVMLVAEGEAIGMGRVVGDGGLFFQIVDIVVHPSYRGAGHGKAIVGALMEWLRANAPETASVSLLADVPADALYAQFGFKETGPVTIGMARRL